MDPSARRPPKKLLAGTRGSPLALVQTRQFIGLLREHISGSAGLLEEHVIRTTGDRVQDRRLADIGGKGLFAKEIHEALAAGAIDFAVHSLKDLETGLPDGIVLACALRREDPRDALILAPGNAPADPGAPFDCLAPGARVGTSSVRRQAQMLHARPDLVVTPIRGNVQTRLDKLASGDCAATLLAISGLLRLGLEDKASAVLDPDAMVPAACQGIIGITVREDATELREMLAAIADPEAMTAAAAERAVLGILDGSCRTPIGAYAKSLKNGDLRVTGLVAREDGTFLLRRTVEGAAVDARRLGAELGASLRRDCPPDIFA